MLLAEVDAEGDGRRRLGWFGGWTIDDGVLLNGCCAHRFYYSHSLGASTPCLVHKTRGNLIHHLIVRVNSKIWNSLSQFLVSQEHSE